MCLEQEQQEHKLRSKNTNLVIKIQKLKISKSQFSQTQQNHLIIKPQSIKSIQKYNTTNPNKKTSNSENHIPSKLNLANRLHVNPDSVAITEIKKKKNVFFFWVMGEKNDVVLQTFRALVEGVARKFVRVRDVPAYGHVTSRSTSIRSLRCTRSSGSTSRITGRSSSTSVSTAGKSVRSPAGSANTCGPTRPGFSSRLTCSTRQFSIGATSKDPKASVKISR